MEAGRKLELFVYKGRGSVDLQHLTLSCILTTSRFTHSLIFFKSPFFGPRLCERLCLPIFSYYHDLCSPLYRVDRGGVLGRRREGQSFTSSAPHLLGLFRP